MKYADIIAKYVTNVPVFVEMYDKQLIKLTKAPGGGVDTLARWHIASPETKKYMILITAQKNAAIKMETYLLAQELGPGPKVFRPSVEQCFALEKMKLTIDVEDFAMPFPTMILELPEEYLKARNPNAACSVLHFNKEANFFLHCVNNADGTAYKAWHPINDGQEVESWFDGKFKDMGDIPIQMDEKDAEETFRRVALNYCLLLDEVGCHLVGPDSPNKYSELVRTSQRNKVFKKNNKINVRTHPMVYAIDREVQLVKIVKNESELPAATPADTGRTLSPHNRRGYYRMQPHGPANSLRKRIRIPAVIVNKHLLSGPPPTQEYRT
jgi:hypothetical protein